MTDSRFWQALACGTLALVLAGCQAVGPDYRAPALPEPPAALPQTQGGSAIQPSEMAAWWSVFGDPALTRLVEQSLSSNRTYQVAVARVREARSRLRVSRAGLLPQLDASGAAKRLRTSHNTMSRYDGEDYAGGFDASWELDLFGRRRRAVEAAQAELDAECATLDNVWVSLAAETARTYTRVQTVRQHLAVAQTNLLLQAQTLAILESRSKAGLTDGLAVEQARYNLEQTRAVIPGLQSDEQTALNALAVLVGTMPGERGDELALPAPIPAVEPRQLTGIPAELLRRRPDIRAAERRLAAATARVGEATADRYPTFMLNGSLGLESLDANDFLNARSRFFSLGPSVSLPIFRAGSIRANIEAKNALQEQALAQYEQTVLAAVQELRDALADYVREYERKESLARAAQAARAAVTIAQDQYRNGLTIFTGVLDAQRSLLAFEEAVTVSEGAITENLIRVYKALGGGWQVPHHAVFEK